MLLWQFLYLYFTPAVRKVKLILLDNLQTKLYHNSGHTPDAYGLRGFIFCKITAQPQETL